MSTLALPGMGAPAVSPEAKPKPESAPYHAAIVAARKSGIAGWQWCSVECIGDPRQRNVPRDVLFEGGVPTRKYARGPRKGQVDWRGVPRTKVVVTEAEANAEKARVEADEGKCHNCGGSGQEAWSWSKSAGDSYRTCGRCGGNGKPPQASQSTKAP